MRNSLRVCLRKALLSESTPSCVTPFYQTKQNQCIGLILMRDSDLMADENPEEPTLRTRSMAGRARGAGTLSVLLKSIRSLRPLRLRRKKPESCTIVSPHWFPRMAGNSTEPGEQTEIGEPSYGDVGGQNQLMSSWSR